MQTKIDTTEPPTPNTRAIMDSINYCETLKHLVCWGDARPPDEIALVLGISERTLVRWREAGCPTHRKQTESGQTAYHYCGQELLFWIIRRYHNGIDGLEMPERVLQYLEWFKLWQEAHVKAGNLEAVIPPEQYEASGLHNQFMGWLWYDSGELEPFADVCDGCPLLIYTESIEPPEYKKAEIERIRAAAERFLSNVKTGKA
ncbi:MAG: hypothetical protein JJU29_12580 [Verrucomicrobia bacterium]|nr:hypothetical protein [Verrucomicrobiota bacterium]MCH8510842.1 hypothetical protein [Kiritimatiellia bacterium]